MVLCLARCRGQEKIVGSVRKETERRRGNGEDKDDREENKWT